MTIMQKLFNYGPQNLSLFFCISLFKTVSTWCCLKFLVSASWEHCKSPAGSLVEIFLSYLGHFSGLQDIKHSWEKSRKLYKQTCFSERKGSGFCKQFSPLSHIDLFFIITQQCNLERNLCGLILLHSLFVYLHVFIFSVLYNSAHIKQ